jgi:hypothetical protein
VTRPERMAPQRTRSRIPLKTRGLSASISVTRGGPTTVRVSDSTLEAPGTASMSPLMPITFPSWLGSQGTLDSADSDVPIVRTHRSAMGYGG